MRPLLKNDLPDIFALLWDGCIYVPYDEQVHPSSFLARVSYVHLLLTPFPLPTHPTVNFPAPPFLHPPCISPPPKPHTRANFSSARGKGCSDPKSGQPGKGEGVKGMKGRGGNLENFQLSIRGSSEGISAFIQVGRCMEETLPSPSPATLSFTVKPPFSSNVLTSLNISFATRERNPTFSSSQPASRLLPPPLRPTVRGWTRP